MSLATKVVFVMFFAALAGLFALHRDLSLTLGNSEWDYVATVYN